MGQAHALYLLPPGSLLPSGVAHFNGLAVGRKYLDVQAQRLHFFNKNLEGFRDTRLSISRP